MSDEAGATGVGRRAFLAGVATTSAALAAIKPGTASAQESAKLGPPSPVLLAADTEPLQATATASKYHILDPGSDYMVDVVRNLDIDYLAAMPGSTFRGIQESFLNYDIGKKPEWITVVHEEASAALAHGYAKVAGKPMAILVHSTVGLQHASMAMYNAWCDRVPMLVLVGNIEDATLRRPGVEWDHTATDLPAMVRGFIKYDDVPVSLDQFRESTTRAYALMTTPPMGPAVIVVDGMLAEYPVGKPAPIPPYRQPSPPVGDPTALDQAAKWLVAADHPVLVAGRLARTARGMDLLVQLAELLQAPVKDLTDRMNFPNKHYLNQSFDRTLIGEADVIVNLENDNLFGVVADVPDDIVRHTVIHIKPGTKVVDINSELVAGAGNYQDKQRYFSADLSIPGDAEATLPLLIEAVQRNLTPARRAQNDQRAEHYRAAFASRLKSDLTEAALGWDASPISVPRMCMEVWNQIQHEPWALVSQSAFLSSWPQRLWDFTKYTQWIGGSGGGGVGYQGAAGVGAALGYKGTGQLPVNICGDGELMVLPGSLWTLAHHEIPLLTVMHNNRAWHQEHMHVLRMADRRERNPNRTAIGTVIDNPAIDYAKVAQGFGLYAEGPITDPAALGPALVRAIRAVKNGQPALVDVVTQGR